MDRQIKYTKMSDLVGESITIEAVGQFKYKKWDNETRKMLVSDSWQRDYQKVYQVATDKGTLDMAASKIGEMLESVSKEGQSSIIGRSFSVKSNGKTGIDIRYYINPERSDQSGDGYKWAQEVFSEIKGRVQQDDEFEPISLDEIPF